MYGAEVAMRMLITSLIASGLVAGCAMPGQTYASLERDVDALIQAHGPACVGNGYAEETLQWRNCVYQLGKAEYTLSNGTEFNFPLIHRLGQRLQLISGGERTG
jgi:hypothetical protein